jgi:hypothetical protein
MTNASFVKPDETSASWPMLAAQPEEPQQGTTAVENMAILAVQPPSKKSPAPASVRTDLKDADKPLASKQDDQMDTNDLETNNPPAGSTPTETSMLFTTE